MSAFVLNVLLMLPVGVAVIGSHEIAHYLVARFLEVPARLGWSRWYPVTRVPAVALAGRRDADVLIALAGPVWSVLLGMLMLRYLGSVTVFWAAGVASIAAGVGAAVPGYRGSDGRRAIRAIRATS